ncbi:MAG: 16S rRNA (guanine(527)-N(7))-methyltransferase RsmG [Pyrinomonadaceae bacterium]
MQEFLRTLQHNSSAYGLELTGDVAERLREYYEQVVAWNARLHLVAPCSPAEFATRHVLESLFAARFMKPGANFADVGSGAGLPAIPCLVARPDLRAALVEASPKKAVFLREALRRLELPDRAAVIAARFEKIETPAADYVTCRALERFSELLPAMSDWSPPAATLLLFGGVSLRDKLESLGADFESHLLPRTEQRFLFVINKKST